MSDFDSNSHIEHPNRRLNPHGIKLAPKKDLLMEQILENLNNTPIGQVLQKIASLPEVRRDKILDVRRQLTDGKYELNERLDIALDKVLEDLTAQ
jgi:hypothetical protein